MKHDWNVIALFNKVLKKKNDKNDECSVTIYFIFSWKNVSRYFLRNSTNQSTWQFILINPWRFTLTAAEEKKRTRKKENNIRKWKSRPWLIDTLLIILNNRYVLSFLVHFNNWKNRFIKHKAERFIFHFWWIFHKSVQQEKKKEKTN